MKSNTGLDSGFACPLLRNNSIIIQNNNNNNNNVIIQNTAKEGMTREGLSTLSHFHFLWYSMQ